MKRNIPRILFYTLTSALCLLTGLLFGRLLFAYTVPMQDSSYNLSLIDDMDGMEGMPENWQYDQKGWTVFLQEGEQQTLMTADGSGGFTGLEEPGQTFYFSRPLTETLNSPTLRLDAADRNIAVFLDGKLLYADCPELDNRIGYLTMPMLDWVRTEPVVVSLPLNYHEKTLTIAQSTGGVETQTPELAFTVWPISVYLYCGYSYESGLISESFRAAIPAALCFGTGILLLAVFLWQVFSHKTDWGLPLLSLTAFLWGALQITKPDFFSAYFGTFPVDMMTLTRLLSVTVLLLFLTSRLSKKARIFFGILTILQGTAVLLNAIPAFDTWIGFVWNSVPERIGLLELSGILVCMAWEWKQRNLFSRFFCPLTITGMAALTVWILAVPALRQEAVQQFLLGAQGYFLWKLMGIVMPAAILAAFLEWSAKEIARRTETKLLAQQYELAQSSLENMRRHQEEVMMLRHDMKKHLLFLRQSASDKKTLDYLDELIGQQEALSPVVQSRNRTLDIILNAKLGEASEKQITVEIVRSDVPEFLPLSDAELCALIMNLLDNAIHAACKAQKPFLRLDMHQKEDFFVFICENAAAHTPPEENIKKETAPQHGLGMKIIEQIIKRHGNLMEIEQFSDSYRVTIALLLYHSPKYTDGQKD